MNCYFLINTVSGGHQGLKVAAALESLIRSGSLAGRVVLMRLAHLKEQLEEARDFDMIIIGGGDGSFSHVLSRPQAMNLRIGLLPLGTGNDLAREMGIGRTKISKLHKMVAMQSEAQTSTFQIWRFDYGGNFEHHINFCNYVSLGFDGCVIDSFSRWRARIPVFSKLGGRHANRLGYFLAGLRHCRSKINLEGLRIEADGEVCALKPAWVRSLMITNISSVMGVGISNVMSNCFDDKIELSVCSTFLHYASMITSHKTLLPKPIDLGGHESWKLSGIPPGIKFQIDGEARPEVTTSQFRVVKAHTVKLVRMLANSMAPQARF